MIKKKEDQGSLNERDLLTSCSTKSVKTRNKTNSLTPQKLKSIIQKKDNHTGVRESFTKKSLTPSKLNPFVKKIPVKDLKMSMREFNTAKDKKVLTSNKSKDNTPSKNSHLNTSYDNNSYRLGLPKLKSQETIRKKDILIDNSKIGLKTIEDSLNNSNFENLTSVSTDKNRNIESENSSKRSEENKSKSPLGLLGNKLPYGLGNNEKIRKIYNPIPKFLKKTEFTKKTNKEVCTKTEGPNSIGKTNNQIKAKKDFKSSFQIINKVTNTNDQNKITKIICEGKTSLNSSFVQRKLIKTSSQKQIVSRAKHLDILHSDLNEDIKKSIKNMHILTKTGFDGVAQKKENQDNYFIYKNLNGVITSRFFAVCDGHGVNGHKISTFLKTNLPILLEKKLKNNFNNKSQKEIIQDTFLEVNNNLKNHKDIDSQYSGSTCSSLIYTMEKIVTANVGDSRAIIGRLENGEWISINLTRDHKPNELDEAERILKNHGIIHPFKEDNNEFVGPQRVWTEADEVPGLAMTRSFGDQVAATVGVICIPEIKEYKFDKGDSFFILASDGLWEFIESKECVEMVKDFYIKNDIIGACNYLYNESKKRWMKEEEVIDDITILMVFLK